MNRTLLRTLSIAALSASALFGALTPALASGNWSWTDISSKIAERQNRPVWAMAYASPYWYFTDGQELWSGGHVWKTEGSVMSDITADVRNAGITRVDDMVTDGQSILFLKNITARSNVFEIVSYNGTFTNLTSLFRGHLMSDEGIASISGQNGTWGIVTSRGRIALYTPSSDRFIEVRGVSSSYQQIPYMLNHVSVGDTGAAHLTSTIQPLNGSWFLTRYDNGVRFERVDVNGNVSTISNGLNMDYVDAFATNGSSVLIAGIRNQGTSVVGVFDGTSFRDVSSASNVLPTGLAYWRQSQIYWDGSSWMVLNGKDFARFDGTTFEYFGKTRDLFVTGAGSMGGTFLLGGVESSDAYGNSPSYPLRLKLVKADENSFYGSSGSTSSGTYGGGHTSTSYSGPTIVTTGNPFNFRVGNGGTFIYRATASDSNGVDHIGIYVNGTLIKTCYADSCEFSTQYYANGNTTRVIPFTVRATDRIGYSTDATVEYLTVDQSSTTAGSVNNSQTSAAGTSYWTWLEPNQTTIRRDQTVGFNVGAYDTNGIKRIEVYENGTIRRTCDFGVAYGNQTCIATIYGSEFLVGTSVAVNAKITDGADQVTWTTLQNEYVTDVNGSTSSYYSTNADVSAWMTLDPSGSTLARNASKIVHVMANATQGLSRIDVYVNGSIRRACSLSQAYGTQTCDLTVYGTDYASGNTVSVNAVATDWSGRTAWSDTKSFTIQDTGSSNGTTNGNATSWIWSDPNVTSIRTNQDVTFNVGANDTDGIRRIEMIVNGSIQQTCDTGNLVYGNEQCSVVIHGSNYSVGTNVYVNAKITDAYGNVIWSDAKTYNVTSSTGGTTSGDSTGSVSISSNADGGFANGQTITFTATASDPDGIQKIDILVNGATAQTCYATGSCVYVGGPYNDRTSVSYGANMTDNRGNVTWTGYKTINKQ